MGSVTGKLAWLLAAALISTASSGAAQSGNATIYRDRNFSGPAVAVDKANPNMRLNFQVLSIRVERGPWEICSQPNFRGNCQIIRQSSADLRRSHNWAGALQSMRPADTGWGGGGSGGGGSGGVQQSLKGMASEFFPAPRANGRPGAARVLACSSGTPTAACAAKSADAFCRTAGWGGSARELMETENRRIYLADVLCVRSGF